MVYLAQGSTRYNLSKTSFMKCSITIPTNPKEQEKIADVLGILDSNIDTTKAIIEKIKLVKQGLMQDILTRGIDKSGKLRPTYAEAPHLYKASKLGFVPIEWEVETAFDNVQIINGGTPSTNIQEYWGGNIGWLSVDDFNKGERYVYKAKKSITSLGLKNSSTNILLKNMLIISARGTVGVLAQVGDDLAFNQSCYGLNTIGKINNDFLYYYLLNTMTKMKRLSYGNVFDTITKDTFKEIHIPIPIQTEQTAISNRLTAMDEKIQGEQKYLDKLNLIKKGLMQDLLTGKVRCKF